MTEATNDNFDCELSLTTNELEYLFETGEVPLDMDRAYETMLELATKRKGNVTCRFVVKYEEPTEAVEEEEEEE